MRFVNAGGRAALLVDSTVHDLNEISGGRIPSSPMAVVVDHWADAVDVHAAGAFDGGTPVESAPLLYNVPAPS